MKTPTLGRFARLGRKLDRLIERGLKLFKGEDPPPAHRPPEDNLNLPPIVWLDDPFNGRYPAYLIRKISPPAIHPSIHTKVDITDEESFAEALSKAGYSPWTPQLRLIDEGERNCYNVDYNALSQDLKKDSE